MQHLWSYILWKTCVKITTYVAKNYPAAAEWARSFRNGKAMRPSSRRLWFFVSHPKHLRFKHRNIQFWKLILVTLKVSVLTILDLFSMRSVQFWFFFFKAIPFFNKKNTGTSTKLALRSAQVLARVPYHCSWRGSEIGGLSTAVRGPPRWENWSQEDFCVGKDAKFTRARQRKLVRV